MARITLSPTEVEIAKVVGFRRWEIASVHARPTARDFTGDLLANDVESVAAEMAVAKALNLYPEWSPTEGEVPTFDLKHNGHKLDVKSTKHPNGNLLIPNPLDDNTYVLTRGKSPTFEIVGCMPGNMVKKVGIYTDQVYIPCWTVPSSKLYPLEYARQII